MKAATALVCALWWAGGIPSVHAQDGALEIVHEPVGCMLAGKYPLIHIDIRPAEMVARLRLHFRGRSDDWQYVEMIPDETGFVGMLPPPKTGSFAYRVEVWLSDGRQGRTGDIPVVVVKRAKQCPANAVLANLGARREVTVFDEDGKAIAPIPIPPGQFRMH